MRAEYSLWILVPVGIATTLLSSPVASLGQACGEVCDAAAEFSLTTNSPDGPNWGWRYGRTDSSGGGFLLDDRGFRLDVFWIWDNGPIGDVGAPGFFYNTNTTTTAMFGTGIVPPCDFGMHPGPNGEKSVLRWIALRTGTYRLAGSFMGIDSTYPTSSDATILVGSIPILGPLFINGFGPPSSVPFSFTLSVVADQTVDFAVGYGDNGDYFGDSTSLCVNVEPSREKKRVKSQGRISTPGGMGHFVLAIPSGSPTGGNFIYDDRAAGLRLRSAVFTAVICIAPNQVRILGTALVNGTGPFDFVVDIFDGGTGPNDTFAITIPALGYTAQGSLVGGNIVIY